MLISSASSQFCSYSTIVNPEFEKSPEKLKQIDGVVREILKTGIPCELKQLEVMIVILSDVSCIEDNRMLIAVWRLRQDLIHIAAIYRSE